MKFKLAIGDVLDVPVKGEVADGSGKVPVKFTLQMRRVSVAAYREALKPESEVLVRDWLLDNATGWRGQRLVLGDDDQPAEYSREAFDCLLGVVGMEQLCFAAYLQALQVSHTPAGRAGN